MSLALPSSAPHISCSSLTFTLCWILKDLGVALLISSTGALIHQTESYWQESVMRSLGEFHEPVIPEI